jgi:hypothetical protein
MKRLNLRRAGLFRPESTLPLAAAFNLKAVPENP